MFKLLTFQEERKKYIVRELELWYQEVREVRFEPLSNACLTPAEVSLRKLVACIDVLKQTSDHLGQGEREIVYED